MRLFRGTTVSVASLLLLSATATAAAADEDLRDGIDLSGIGSLNRFVTDLRLEITDLRLEVTDLRLPTPTDIERTEQDGEETVIALDSDILFAFDKAEISPTAADRIEQIVADIPEGTALQIGGHTDSMGSEERNEELSSERAEAVAGVIREARPDLSLTVEGFGPREPVADNNRAGKDYPEGRALNRRVEIRYAE